jgi:hypothetical protein
MGCLGRASWAACRRTSTQPPAQYFFEVVQRLEMNGYLLNNKMGQAFFAELVKERPGRGDEIAALAAFSSV